MIDSHNMEIKLSKDTKDLIEAILWLIHDLPEDLILSSTKKSLTLYKGDKRLNLIVED